MTVSTFNGDCLDIMPTIPEGSVDMILTDLPYGTTNNGWDSVVPLDRLWDEYRRIAKDDAAVVLFSQQPFTTILGASNIRELRYEWIWEKSHPTGFLNASRAPLKNHENILVFYRRAPTYNPQLMPTGKRVHQTKGGAKSTNYGEFTVMPHSGTPGMGYPRSIIRFGQWKGGDHPTQKPVELCEFLIRSYTDEGDTVLDSCMGSGTTGVAAVRAGRSFIGIEIDPGFYGRAVERISEAERTERDYMNGQTRLGRFQEGAS